MVLCLWFQISKTEQIEQIIFFWGFEFVLTTAVLEVFCLSGPGFHKGTRLQNITLPKEALAQVLHTAATQYEAMLINLYSVPKPCLVGLNLFPVPWRRSILNRHSQIGMKIQTCHYNSSFHVMLALPSFVSFLSWIVEVQSLPLISNSPSHTAVWFRHFPQRKTRIVKRTSSRHVGQTTELAPLTRAKWS